MKIGIISDIEGHDGNLSAVLTALAGCRYIFNLGDSIGGRGDSDRVVALLSRADILSVAGNHDLEVLLKKSVPADRQLAQMLRSSDTLYHPKVHLNDESLTFIKKLKMIVKTHFRQKTMALCHSLYGRLDGDLYFDPVNEENAHELIAATRSAITFVGHSHRPSIVVVQNSTNAKMVTVTQSISIALDARYTYIVNPGSVGAPRLKGIKSSYAVFDPENSTLSMEVIK